MSNSQLERYSERDLLRLYAEVMTELRHRKVVRSSNNPTADYAELLVCRALKLVPAPKSTTGYDAENPDGVRYEVKGRRLTPENQSRQLSAIRGLDKRHFHFLAGVLFETDFTVARACLVPWETVEKGAEYRSHVNAWILHLRDSLWEKGGVIDITTELIEAQNGAS